MNNGINEAIRTNGPNAITVERREADCDGGFMVTLTLSKRTRGTGDQAPVISGFVVTWAARDGRGWATYSAKFTTIEDARAFADKKWRTCMEWLRRHAGN